jgi:hypothetical protein
MGRRWASKFLAALEQTANVTTAAEAAGITRQAAYAYRKQSPEFAVAWDAALDVGVGTLEDEAVRRARDGVEEPIYYEGECVGTVRRYSDTLLIFLLKSHKPGTYAPPQRVQNEHEGGLRVEVIYTARTPDLAAMTDDDDTEGAA